MRTYYESQDPDIGKDGWHCGRRFSLVDRFLVSALEMSDWPGESIGCRLASRDTDSRLAA